MDIQIKKRGSSVRIRLRVRPGGSRDAIVGPHGGALKLTVTAAPDKGKANQAVLRLLSRALNLPLASLSLISGTASRDKTVEIRDLTPEDLLDRLHEHI